MEECGPGYSRLAGSESRVSKAMGASCGATLDPELARMNARTADDPVTIPRTIGPDKRPLRKRSIVLPSSMSALAMLPSARKQYSVIIPEQLAANCRKTPARHAWLDSLPGMLKALTERWSLRTDVPF